MTAPSIAGLPFPKNSMTPQVAGQQEPSSFQKEKSHTAFSQMQPAVTVAPADHVLTLVSSSVVNQRGFANTCGVPLGAHMDLRPPEALRLPLINTRPPLRCNGCSAFLNVYCKANLSKGVWKCYMCGAVNIQKDLMGEAADVTAFPELSSEAVEYSVALPPSHPLLPAPGPGHLVFAIDTTLEPKDLQAVREALLTTLASPCLDPSTLISLITFDGCVAVHNLGSQRFSHVLPIAGTSTAAVPPGSASSLLDLQSVVQHLLDRHCAATASRRAGGDGSSGGFAAGAAALVSDVGSCSPHLPKVLASLRTVQSGVPVRARARCLGSAVEAALRIIAAHASLDLTRHHNLYGSRVIVLAGGPATRGPDAVPLELLDQAVPEKGRAPDNRAVAAALDVGVALGDMASKIGVAVDIFTSTPTGVNAKLLTAITHGSGGEFMPQMPPHPHPHSHPHPHHPSTRVPPTSSTPGSPQASSPQSQPPTPSSSLPQPQQQQQQQQHQQQGGKWGDSHQQGQAAAATASGSGSGSGGFIGFVLSRQLTASLTRRFGLEGRLDCYCSEGLRLVQWFWAAGYDTGGAGDERSDGGGGLHRCRYRHVSGGGGASAALEYRHSGSLPPVPGCLWGGGGGVGAVRLPSAGGHEGPRRRAVTLSAGGVPFREPARPPPGGSGGYSAVGGC
ncbi:hypothetical protein Vretimale_7479 [Volvox reticuliferus]|uniref:Protein transport protein SEC23 n=1 Tax=Volvox reticuliferus TaxID=1737510 RepID=A0A8J4LN79_9CHLO|nr:hypothetical protein Vretimale_7479 [Volvox reticuliferus]